LTRIAVITFNVVPESAQTAKYTRLGALALDNHRQYADRHGYSFIDSVPIAEDRPCCWAKLPAICDAFEDHDWVIWLDSDVLIFDLERPLDSFIDTDQHLVVQKQGKWWNLVGVEDGDTASPINSGVFLIRACDWSLQFLKASYAQTRFVTGGSIWDGIGEQEGMNQTLIEHPEYRRHIRYVDRLQCAPAHYESGEFSVHFYGNNARYRLPPNRISETLDRWENAVRTGDRLPDDIKRFHWSAIQNQRADALAVQSDLQTYMYGIADIA
jgi:hypothetical protein